MSKKGKENPRFKDRTGEKHITNEGYEVEVIKYSNTSNCTIKFEDGCVVENVYYKHIKKGHIKNPYHKTILDVGFFGQGKHKGSAKSKRNKEYNCWSSMLKRCYDKKHQEKIPTYIGCMVDEKWHNFQNFAEWFDENYIDGWQLDKDILIKENKVYSPKTCCFVPKEINYILTKRDSKRGDFPIGVCKWKNGKYRGSFKQKTLGYYKTPEEAFQAYKTEKEKHIKEVADKWKNLISEKVYKAMYNYKVEITD